MKHQRNPLEYETAPGVRVKRRMTLFGVIGFCVIAATALAAAYYLAALVYVFVRGIDQD